MFKTSRLLNSLKSTIKSNQAQKLDDLCFPINLTKPPNFNSSTTSSISNTTLIHLHQLSALKLPKESSPGFDSLKSNLNQILKIINSIHDFPESKNRNYHESIQDLILSRSKEQQINWNDLIESQQTFLKSKLSSIPGMNSNKDFLETRNQDCLEESNQVKEMSLKHLIKRKGLGNSPHKESLYYFVKRVEENQFQ